MGCEEQPLENAGNMGIQQKWDLNGFDRQKVGNHQQETRSSIQQAMHTFGLLKLIIARFFSISTALYCSWSSLKVKRTKANKCNSQAPICTPAACGTKTHCPALRSHVEHIQTVSATIHCPGSTLAVFSSFGHLDPLEGS